VWVLSQNKPVTLFFVGAEKHSADTPHWLQRATQKWVFYPYYIFLVGNCWRTFVWKKIWYPRHSQATLLMMKTTMVDSSLNTLWLISSCIAVSGRIFLCKYSNWHIVDHYDRSDTVLLCKM
jgi:hypothetical protein